jgi:hypothetical protein
MEIYMAFDQTKAFTQLEVLVKEKNKDTFFFDFMLAFKTPRATITKLKNNIGSDVSSNEGEFRLKNKIHFKSVQSGMDLHEQCNRLKQATSTLKENIRFVFVTDFNDVVAYDTKAKTLLDVEFVDLHKNYAFFLPLAGIEKYELTDEHPADIKAAYKLGQLCDVIRRHNTIDTPEKVHAFNVFLTRLLFCFYAEDTGIFTENQLITAVTNTTDKSGSDLDNFFIQLFRVLNLPNEASERANLPSHFASFPYVNGGLFAIDEWVPTFTGKARRMIIEAGSLEWDKINPDIFGSMFQAVIDPKQRGKLGQHYTSVPNIMKVIKPLFLDEFEEALEKAKHSTKKLQALLFRLQRTRYFDAACGSGNFLIIIYKELRHFEMKVFKALDALGEQSVMFMSGIRLSQFYGIEIDDFAHEIALLSLWLAENQMNKLFEAEFGHSEPMLPLKESGNIVHGNALRLNWEQVCPKKDEQGDLEVYICGNPPFLGARVQTQNQKEDLALVFEGHKDYKDCDYVSGWLIKGSEYIGNSDNVACSFVATNSICQGEQVGYIWTRILKWNEILFAHQSFKWSNSAQDKAAVICVIVGYGLKKERKKLFSGDEITYAQHISPYLIDSKSSFVSPRKIPFSGPRMLMGSMPRDGGNLILSPLEKQKMIEKDHRAEKFIRPLYGAQELLSSSPRCAIWIEDSEVESALKVKEIAERVEKVKNFRLDSKAKTTNQYAAVPYRFAQRTLLASNTIIIPSVSSERRHYIPMAYFSEETISTNANFVINNASLYDFSILTSEMHNDWMRTVAGRLESRYRYSATLVYNTFPWPEVSEKQKKEISELGEEVLLTRADYPDKTLAQLYDPDKMPEPLKKAHIALDLAVEQLYRDKPFEDAAERVAFLFKRYEKLINTKEGHDA